MALKIADLFVEVEARGDAQSRLSDVRQGAERAEASSRKLSSRLQQIDGPRRAEAQVKQLDQEVSRVGQTTEKVGEKLTSMGEKLGGMGEGAGGGLGAGIMAGVTSKVAPLATKAGPIGAAVFGVAALGLGAGALLMQQIMKGVEAERQQDFIQAQLGINEDAMRTVAKAAGAAYGNVFGESVTANMQTAKSAIESGLLNGEETAQEMQPVIEKLTMVSEMLGEDVPRTSRTAAQMIKNGIAKDATEAFDLLVKSTQNQLNVSEDLLDTFDEYSTKFRDIGLDGPESMGLLSQAVKAGARDTDVAADALKEFQIKATDGSEAAAAAYQTLGLSAEEMTRKIAEGGPAAREGLREVLNKLREMPPGFERNAAAVGLFGTKAEDLGEALYAMDLDTAVQEFGAVGGAAQKAADVMGDNAATKIEEARRKIEVSMSSMSNSLGQAFGPVLGQIADWVSAHQPEITAFFAALADGALATLEVFLTFTEGGLRYLANLASGIDEFVGAGLVNLGNFTSMLAGLVEHIPGMADDAEMLKDLGDTMVNFGEATKNTSERLTSMADAVGGANDKLGGLRGNLQDSAEDAVHTQEMVRGLQDSVVDLSSTPGEVYITDNTPEVNENLRQMGLKIVEVTRQDGSKAFKIVAETAEGQARLDSFVRTNTGRSIDMFVDLRQRQIGYWQSQGVSAEQAPLMQGPVPVSQNAEGGIYPWTPGGINQFAEKGPEAFIPLDPSKKVKAKGLVAEVANRLGMMVTQWANGGITAGDLTNSASGLEGASYVWGGWDGTWNTDCSGAQARMANKIVYGDFNTGGRFATGNQASALSQRNFVTGEAPPNTPAYEIGWVNGGPGGGHTAGTLWDGYGNGTNFEMGGSRGDGQVGGSASGARDFPNIMYFPLASSIGTGTGTDSRPDTRTPRERNIDTVIAEGRRRGMSDKQIKTAVMTMLAESEAGGSSENVFQQQEGPQWGGNEGIDRDAAQFYDAMAKVPNQEGMTEAQLAQAVQQSAFEDGSNYAARSAEADREIAAAAARSVQSSQRSSQQSGSYGSTVMFPSTMDVNVLNWPDSLTKGDSARARLSIAAYANGGTVPGVGHSDSELIAAMPGEEVIKKGPASRHRGLLKAINAGRFSEGGTVGGFGGGYSQTPDPAKRLSLSEWAALAAGLGFGAASGFDSSGKFHGFSTGTTTVPGLDDALRMLAEKLQPVPAVVVEEARIENVNPSDPNSLLQELLKLNPSQVQITQKGLL